MSNRIIERVVRFLERVKSRLTNSRIYTTEELATLAGEQISRLRKRLDELVGREEIAQEKADILVVELEWKRPRAIKKAAGIRIKKGHLAILPVIGKRALDVSLQTEMARYGEQVCHTSVRSSEINDVINILADGCYWLVDIEDGRECFGESPGEVETFFVKRRRSGLTVTEVISLCVQTDVLSDHSVGATGSRCRWCDYVPCLTFDKIWLALALGDDSHGEQGSASCGSRVA